MCGQPQPDQVIAPLRLAGQTESSGPHKIIGDVTGDGLSDLMGTCHGDCMLDPDGGSVEDGIWLLAGSSDSEALNTQDLVVEADHRWATDPGLCYTAQQVLDAGDLNGDGIADIVAPISSCYWGLYPHYGPIDSTQETEWLAMADARYASGWHTAWGYPFFSGADFDGDGREDLGVISDNGLDLWFGGQESIDPSVQISQHDLTGYQLDTCSDLDGDGIGDLVGGLPRIGWISGATLAESDGASFDDLIEGSLDNSDPDGAPLSVRYVQVRCIGDWDGSGLPELAVGWQHSESLGHDRGEVLLFVDGYVGEESTSNADSSIVGDREDQEFGRYLFPSPTTDDLWVTDVDSSSFLIPRSQGLPPYRSELSDLRTYQLQQDQAPGGWASASGDLDGNGFDEFTFVISGEGGIHLYMGWDIPWDDDTWW